MIKKNKIGFDLYDTTLHLHALLKTAKENDFVLYMVSTKENHIFFYSSIRDRNKIQKIEKISYQYTSGLMGMILRNGLKKSRIVSYVIVIITWFLLSTTCFEFKIMGESDSLDFKIQQILEEELYKKIDVSKTKNKIYKEIKNDISWMEVYQKGSILHIQYAKRDKDKYKKKYNQPLIAKKDGVIAYFECDEGFKIKKVNEVVKKGDIIVDNVIIDSSGKSKKINVNGKVFAYTWEKVVMSIEDNKIPSAINYFQMILQARSDITSTMSKEEKIHKENVLQFTKNKGKIRLVILYTLLEDITS